MPSPSPCAGRDRRGGTGRACRDGPIARLRAQAADRLQGHPSGAHRPISGRVLHRDGAWRVRRTPPDVVGMPRTLGRAQVCTQCTDPRPTLPPRAPSAHRGGDRVTRAPSRAYRAPPAQPGGLPRRYVRWPHTEGGDRRVLACAPSRRPRPRWGRSPARRRSCSGWRAPPPRRSQRRPEAAPHRSARG